MKREFQVGDRVAVYTGAFLKGAPAAERLVGTVKTAAAYIQVRFDDPEVEEQMGPHPLHPKQCRLLKTRERVRVWLHRSRDWNHPGFGTRTTPPPQGEAYDWVEFVEVRK